jgi:hypothetical protein
VSASRNEELLIHLRCADARCFSWVWFKVSSVMCSVHSILSHLSCHAVVRLHGAPFLPPLSLKSTGSLTLLLFEVVSGLRSKSTLSFDIVLLVLLFLPSS